MDSSRNTEERHDIILSEQRVDRNGSPSLSRQSFSQKTLIHRQRKTENIHTRLEFSRYLREISCGSLLEQHCMIAFFQVHSFILKESGPEGR